MGRGVLHVKRGAMAAGGGLMLARPREHAGLRPDGARLADRRLNYLPGQLCRAHRHISFRLGRFPYIRIPIR